MVNKNEKLMSIYTVPTSDPKFDSYKIETYTELEELRSQLRILLTTRRGDVLGVPQMGLDFEEFLFAKNVNLEALRKEILNQIQSFCFVPDKYNISVDVNVHLAPERSYNILRIDIYVNNTLILGHNYNYLIR